MSLTELCAKCVAVATLYCIPQLWEASARPSTQSSAPQPPVTITTAVDWEDINTTNRSAATTTTTISKMTRVTRIATHAGPFHCDEVRLICWYVDVCGYIDMLICSTEIHDDGNVAGAGLCPPEAAARVQGCRHHQVMWLHLVWTILLLSLSDVYYGNLIVHLSM